MSAKPKSRKIPMRISAPAALTFLNHSIFDALPDSAFIREAQLVQSAKRPESPVPLPFSAPTLWRLVAKGKFPKPVKLSTRVTCWKVGEVRAWMSAQAANVTSGA